MVTSLRYFTEEERDLEVSSVQQHLQRAQRVWTQTKEAPLRTAEHNRRPAPQYSPEQRVWLSAKEIPLKDNHRKLAPRFIGLYEIDTIICPSAVRLKLPSSLRIHLTFHVSQIKPVSSSQTGLSVDLPYTIYNK